MLFHSIKRVQQLEGSKKNQIISQIQLHSFTNIPLLISIIVTKIWQIHSFDIKCVFLQGKEIDREIHVQSPCECVNENISKLNRIIYGFKDAFGAWNFGVKNELVKLGAQISHYEEALF